MRAAFQGELGTFSQQAILQLLGPSATGVGAIILPSGVPNWFGAVTEGVLRAKPGVDAAMIVTGVELGAVFASPYVAAAQPYLGGGAEISFGKGSPIERVNPFGDWRQMPGRATEWYKRLPHYHRRFDGPGGSINRHRPWQSPGVDKAGNPLNWWKRF